MPSNSGINLGLPTQPLTNIPELFGELVIVYNALRILQQTLDDAGVTPGTGTPTSTLNVAHGGTGATSLTGILKGSGTSPITAITSSTAGHVLTVTGVNAFAFSAPAGGGGAIIDDPQFWLLA